MKETGGNAGETGGAGERGTTAEEEITGCSVGQEEKGGGRGALGEHTARESVAVASS